MDLYEFQAKELISRFGIEIPRGRVAGTPEDAERFARRLGFPRYAIKAQIHGGARGLSGGVRFAESPADAKVITAQLMSKPLVTAQTKASGERVRWVYVEEAFTIEAEIFAAVTIERASGEAVLLVSREGGSSVEIKAAEDPDVVRRFPLVLPLDGGEPTGDFLAAAHAAGVEGALAGRAAAVFRQMAKIVVDLDATLVEINPLAVTSDQRLVALDARLAIDGNAMFRHPALSALRAQIQIEEGDPKELAADRHQINYQRMDGNIGVVVNGAGLALATNDMLIDAGGRPANFMDIRTTASSLDIAYGVECIIDNPKVKVLLISVHGGGMQSCDTVAEGITVAFRRARRTVPLVVRFAGNNADFARVRLKGSGIAFLDASDLTDAVSKVLSLVAKEAA